MQSKRLIVNNSHILSQRPVVKTEDIGWFKYWADKRDAKNKKELAFNKIVEFTKMFLYASDALTKIRNGRNTIIRKALKVFINQLNAGLEIERIHNLLKADNRDQSKLVKCLQLHEDVVRALLKASNLWWWQIDRIIDNLKRVDVVTHEANADGTAKARESKEIAQAVKKAIKEGFASTEKADAAFDFFKDLGLLNVPERAEVEGIDRCTFFDTYSPNTPKMVSQYTIEHLDYGPIQHVITKVNPSFKELIQNELASRLNTPKPDPQERENLIPAYRSKNSDYSTPANHEVGLAITAFGTKISIADSGKYWGKKLDTRRRMHEAEVAKAKRDAEALATAQGHTGATTGAPAPTPDEAQVVEVVPPHGVEGDTHAQVDDAWSEYYNDEGDTHGEDASSSGPDGSSSDSYSQSDGYSDVALAQHQVSDQVSEPKPEEDITLALAESDAVDGALSTPKAVGNAEGDAAKGLPKEGEADAVVVPGADVVHEGEPLT
jgi:hypothetical protein